MIIFLSIIRRIRCSPSSLSPRGCSAAPAGRRGAVPGRQPNASRMCRPARRGPRRAPSSCSRSLDVVVAVAVLHPPEPAGLDLLAPLTTPGRAVVAGDAGERVVELVDQLHVAHAEVVDLVELAVDLLRRALGCSLKTPQSNSFETSMPEHHRELAVVDHAARLERVVTIRNQPLPGPPFCASM